MQRVADADEAYMIAERLRGWGAPIQYVWVLPEQPTDDALRQFRNELAAGSFNRRVLPRLVPTARDRWVRTMALPEVTVCLNEIDDSDIGAWADQRLLTVRLNPMAGFGWRLVGTRTTSGKFVLALMVSHMVADGQGVFRALEQARTGTSTSVLTTAGELTRKRRFIDDLRDGGEQLSQACRSAVALTRHGLASRKTQAAVDNSSTPAEPEPSAATKRTPHRPRTSPSGSLDGPEVGLVTMDVPRDQWESTAREYGGTSNSLFTAVIGGLAQRAGVEPIGEEFRICIAVSRRDGEADDRANASGGVWIRVRERFAAKMDLSSVRAKSKKAFLDYAQADKEPIADHLQPVARLLPRALLSRAMLAIPGPDITVSNLGVAPEGAMEVCGITAQSLAIRAVNQGWEPHERRHHGPVVAAWATAYRNTITLAVYGIHPDYVGADSDLAGMLAAELSDWGLTATAW